MKDIDELKKILLEHYNDYNWKDFFETIRDNNLSFEDNYIVTEDGERIIVIRNSDILYFLKSFYNYCWLENNSTTNSTTNNSTGFVDLRC